MSSVAHNYNKKTTMFRMGISNFFQKDGVHSYWRSAHPTVCVMYMLAMLNVNVIEMLYHYADGCSTNVFSRNWRNPTRPSDIMYEILLKT